MASLQMPLGSSLGRVWIEDRPIAEARNALCHAALDAGADYLVMLGDDVLPPPNMILTMLDKVGREYPTEPGRTARASMLTGVYWTKTYPTEPYLWNGLLQGSHKDWTVGELFPVDMAGCDALIIETAMLREIPEPWFSTSWVWEPGQDVSPIATEDFYFYTKARERGFRLFADTSIQCWHEDRPTGQVFGLTTEMRQAGGTPEADGLLVAEIGAGSDSPAWGPGCTVVRFDMREDVHPDVRCDVRAIPPNHHGVYDLVHARHILEHFDRIEAPHLVRHWADLLKPGGRLVIRVPNLSYALDRIASHDSTEGVQYAYQQVYGGQFYPGDYHRNGFTARKLAALLGTVPELGQIEVVDEDGGQNLKATAVLGARREPEAIAPVWEAIRQTERDQAVVERLARVSPSESGAAGVPPAASGVPSSLPGLANTHAGPGGRDLESAS